MQVNAYTERHAHKPTHVHSLIFMGGSMAEEKPCTLLSQLSKSVGMKGPLHGMLFLNVWLLRSQTQFLSMLCEKKQCCHGSMAPLACVQDKSSCGRPGVFNVGVERPMFIFVGCPPSCRHQSRYMLVFRDVVLSAILTEG